MDKGKELLKALYNGKFAPNKDVPNSDEYNKLIQKSNSILKVLLSNLSEENKKILNEYLELKTEAESIDCEEKFIEGYTTAINLMLSGLSIN